MDTAKHKPGSQARLIDLEAQLDYAVSIILAEANDAGYGTQEALAALQSVIHNQKVIYAHDPDPADDPAVDGNCAEVRTF